MNSIRLRAFAKINLGLKILGKRRDGFHEIRTVYQTLTLHDRLEISLHRPAGGVAVECDDATIPSGRGNLVYRAGMTWKRARRFRGGLKIRLEKRIPAGSGLAGGSSDAAVTLLGLERLTGDRLDERVRLRLAADLGSDVPLFLWGGRVLGCGRGEEVYPLEDLPPRQCLLVFPGFTVSTAEAYQEWGRGRLGFRLTSSREAHSMDTFGARSLFPPKHWGPAENDFEQVVFARWPELAKLKRQLIRAGAETASLTGSGSAVYAIFASARQLIRARELVPAGWQTFRTRTLPRREYRRAIVRGE
jgi:4-diphosphocytidyl-2-C-methyl-D-erythritol kinase